MEMNREMNLIQAEQARAKTKMLATIPDTELVSLSSENVALVEAMIQNDSAYLRTSDKAAVPTTKYGGSTAYWMTRLKAVLIGGEYASDLQYRQILLGAIEAVDRENSTHLNADGIGREELLGRLVSIEREKLITYLKEPDRTDLWLINFLAKTTHPTGVSPKGSRYKARTNPSFASKFCHYACFYLFEGEECQDNYSIYDNVLQKVMPEYVKYYGLKQRDLSIYAEYRKTVDEIIGKAEDPISRNGFDHLLWYYFKGRI